MHFRFHQMTWMGLALLATVGCQMSAPWASLPLRAPSTAMLESSAARSHPSPEPTAPRGGETSPAATNDTSQSPSASPVANPDEAGKRRAESQVAVSATELSAEARLLQLIETTDDPVVKRVLAAQLADARRGGTTGGAALHQSQFAPPKSDADTGPAPTADHPDDDNATATNSTQQSTDRSGTHAAQQPTPSSQTTVARAEAAAPPEPPVTAATYHAKDDHAPSPDGSSQPQHWTDALQQAIELLEKQLREPAVREQRDTARRGEHEAILRLLYLAAQQREDALETIDQLDEAEQEFWRELLYGLAVYFQREQLPSRERRMTLVLQHLRRAADALANVADLEVRHVAFCTRVDSYGRYTEFEPYVFRPDQEVLLYVEVDNFSSEQKPDDGQYETALQGSYEIRNLAQQKVAEHTFLVETDLCRNRRRDFFIPYRMYMPKIAPGQYTLQVTIQDVKSKRMGQSAPVQFTIRH